MEGGQEKKKKEPCWCDKICPIGLKGGVGTPKFTSLSKKLDPESLQLKKKKKKNIKEKEKKNPQQTSLEAAGI